MSVGDLTHRRGDGVGPFKAMRGAMLSFELLRGGRGRGGVGTISRGHGDRRCLVVSCALEGGRMSSLDEVTVGRQYIQYSAAIAQYIMGRTCRGRVSIDWRCGLEEGGVAHFSAQYPRSSLPSTPVQAVVRGETATLRGRAIDGDTHAAASNSNPLFAHYTNPSNTRQRHPLRTTA